MATARTAFPRLLRVDRRGQVTYGQNHRGNGIRLGDGNSNFLASVVSRQAANRSTCCKGGGSGRAPDDLAFRHHDKARQEPSGREMARRILNAFGFKFDSGSTPVDETTV